VPDSTKEKKRGILKWTMGVIRMETGIQNVSSLKKNRLM
jgi:hypothetical protein